MTRKQKEKGNKTVKTSSNEDTSNVQQNSVFGMYSGAEMIARVKKLALNPARPEYAVNNIQPLWDQILRLRKVMVLKDSEVPWRKRKLEQLVKDKFRSPPCPILPNPHNITKICRTKSSNASSVSCLLNSVDSTKCRDEKILFHSRSSSSLLTSNDHLPEKQISTECSFLDDMAHWDVLKKDLSPKIDSDESVNGSNPLTPENPTPDEPPAELSNAVHNWYSPMLDGSKQRDLQSPCTSKRSKTFGGYRIQKNVIPVGPRFQADVPEWTGPPNRSKLIFSYKTDPENSKWLGTRVWPIEVGNTKTTRRAIGKGRPDSCSCTSPGSVDCNRRHILETRIRLQCDLGPSFFVWKFDEMGEQVSKLWTLKEQQTLESLVKMRPSSNGNNFLKRALKCFPNKSRKEVINYYFNVYIPQRISLHTRSRSMKQVDTDDEVEDNNVSYMGVQKRSGERTLVPSNSKVSKTRYLREDS